MEPGFISHQERCKVGKKCLTTSQHRRYKVLPSVRERAAYFGFLKTEGKHKQAYFCRWPFLMVVVVVVAERRATISDLFVSPIFVRFGPLQGCCG